MPLGWQWGGSGMTVRWRWGGGGMALGWQWDKGQGIPHTLDVWPGNSGRGEGETSCITWCDDRGLCHAMSMSLADQ
eukprot:2415309-Lingulodinium_polyedra.AAC.1